MNKLNAGLCAALAAMGAQAEGPEDVEVVVVQATPDSRSMDLTDEWVPSPDVTRLLKRVPGGNVNGNGPLTGIPQYRGMYGQRIAVSLDGNQLAPAGPNWMDPPLSYATSGQLASIQVYRGIAPVSVAQESIGGAIEAHTQQGEFSEDGSVRLHGQFSGSAQSASAGTRLAGALQVAGENQRLALAAASERGDDARFPGGDILPTEYQRQRFDIGYGLRAGDHELALHYGYNDTGDTGTPALPMDIEYFEGDLYNLDYRFTPGGDWRLEASLFGSELDHGMTNYHLRRAPADPARWRRNIADASTLGFDLQAQRQDASGSWTAGVDGLRSEHDSNIDNPNNAMFFVVNFNGAQREVLGAFLERQQRLADNWRGEFGLRLNRVETDAGEVNGTPAMMMPPAMQLRDTFNASDRAQSDDNLDLVARLHYDSAPGTTWYLGVAQKHRSPSYQERYLWLPLEATAGLADANLYTGRVDLDPEVAREIEFGLDFGNGTLSLAPRIFYKRVDDYIQGTPSDDMAAIMFVRMMNASNGTSNPDPLRFDNVDAELYGFDMDWHWQLADSWALSGIVNYVRGERRDIDDNLYRIAPPNASLRLDYDTRAWGAGLEVVGYARQDEVSQTNRERETAGYAVVNLSARWSVTEKFSLDAGVENLLDREYEDHLGGYNRAYNPDIAVGERLPGYGINVFARASYRF
ncbi:TonB-dependent receptor [Mangrovimicrobium sediminis]|nr:TonB-dependent receptor [Haliea sp. SAOS-164]